MVDHYRSGNVNIPKANGLTPFETNQQIHRRVRIRGGRIPDGFGEANIISRLSHFFRDAERQAIVYSRVGSGARKSSFFGYGGLSVSIFKEVWRSGLIAFAAIRDTGLVNTDAFAFRAPRRFGQASGNSCAGGIQEA